MKTIIHKKDGVVIKEEEEWTSDEIDMKLNANITQSTIWGTVIVILLVMIYCMIRYGRCGC